MPQRIYPHQSLNASILILLASTFLPSLFPFRLEVLLQVRLAPYLDRKSPPGLDTPDKSMHETRLPSKQHGFINKTMRVWASRRTKNKSALPLSPHSKVASKKPAWHKHQPAHHVRKKNKGKKRTLVQKHTWPFINSAMQAGLRIHAWHPAVSS